MRGRFNSRVLINKVGLSQPKETIVSLALPLMCSRVSGLFSGLQLSAARAHFLTFISPTSLHKCGGLHPEQTDSTHVYGSG